MSKSNQMPLYEFTRGEFVESIHYGSIAISDNQGRLVSWYGDPNTSTFLRSSAKPFQALPFIEANGPEKYDFAPVDIALICSSHSGTDEHVERINALQTKSGVNETELLCGVHPAFDETTAFDMRKNGLPLTPNRHNCSGKHTGMLTYAHMQNWSTPDYLELDHPVQKQIIQSFSEMTGVQIDDIVIGIDGCSAPNFAIPLINTALAYARLCDPQNFSEARATACRKITYAMTDNAYMVGGPNRFDTMLMEVTSGRIVSKEGAEGYQAMGIMPGALGHDSPALGIAFKISDGDLRNRARPAVSLEILSQLNALSTEEQAEMARFGPCLQLKNFQEIETGLARPAFKLNLIQSS